MLTRGTTILVVIDMQDKLCQVMDGKEALLDNNLRLIKGMVALGVPVVLTEQNKIGATVPEVLEALPGQTPIVKASFSCCGEKRFVEELERLAPKQVVLSGIEAHICVYQTAMDLIERGYEVYLAADTIASRTASNKETTIRKLMASGTVLTSAEMALFELLKTSTDPKAREIFGIVK